MLNFVLAAIFSASSAPAAVPMQSMDSHVRFDDPVAEGSFLLVTRDFQVRPIQLAAINDQSLVLMEESRGWVTLDLQQCIALVSIAESDNELRAARGRIVLADGQRLPGEAIIGADARADTLAWSHPWLGRIDVSFKMIESVLLTPDAIAPPAKNADVILMVNGDRQEGFVTAIGDPVTIEVSMPGAEGEAESSQAMNIPLGRVTAISLIAPRQTGTGRRVWFSEGTVLDVQSISVGDDGYVRMAGGPFLGRIDARERGADAQPPRIGVSEVAAVLFDREALIPLASIPPTRVEGPATRYTLPRPVVLDADAALGLSTIDYSGPIIARYALPAGCQRFIAEAELPQNMRTWGDCEIIVRSDDDEVFRAKLNASMPRASINAAIRGRELTVELAAGAYGPVQDRLRLIRAMLLKGK